MRGLVCEQWGHYRDLQLREIDRPAIRPGCVRIKVHYSTISFGQTLLVAGKYQRKPPLPFTPGTEVAGVVVETGEGVENFAPGDRVVAGVDWGGYAEEVIATIETTWHVPDGIELSVAVSLPLTYGTAYAALHWRGGLREGQSLAVYGAAGGVGHAAVEIGVASGAKVIAVAGSEARLDRARESGAKAGLLHGADLGRRIIDANDGQPVDLVFDPVGGDLFREALRCTKPEGKVLLIGFASGEVPQAPANILLVKNIEVVGFNFGYYLGWSPVDERKRYATRLADMMAALFALVGTGALAPVTSSTYPLERVVDAFDALVERRIQGRALVALNQ